MTIRRGPPAAPGDEGGGAKTDPSAGRETLKPLQKGRPASTCHRLPLADELSLALLPTATVLIVLVLLETFSHQRILFASLASSAFLIYLDPEHTTNRVRTLVVAHLTAAALGFSTLFLFGPGYVAAGTAMVLTILLMILLTSCIRPRPRRRSPSRSARAWTATSRSSPLRSP